MKCVLTKRNLSNNSSACWHTYPELLKSCLYEASSLLRPQFCHEANDPSSRLTVIRSSTFSCKRRSIYNIGKEEIKLYQNNNMEGDKQKIWLKAKYVQVGSSVLYEKTSQTWIYPILIYLRAKQTK